MTHPDDVYMADFDLGKFRYAVARYAKLLIRARWKCEPRFLSLPQLVTWDMTDISDDKWPAWRLLDQAATALGLLNMEYLPRCGSGGVRETDETTPVGRLIWAVAGLVEVGDAGGPEHNGALLQAARLLREGKGVDWRTLVAWDTLDAIRADLDQLPHPRRESEPARLDRIEAALDVLVDRQTVKDWYSTSEVASLLGKAEYTVREYCRQGRIHAKKKPCGRGKGGEWLVSHEELTRLRNESLLPVSQHP